MDKETYWLGSGVFSKRSMEFSHKILTGLEHVVISRERHGQCERSDVVEIMIIVS